MLPKDTPPSRIGSTRVISGLRAVERFIFRTLGLRFLFALVFAFALWWYVVPGASTNTPGLATGSYRTVSVLAQLSGSPGDGYAVSSVLVAPPTITIQGEAPGLGDVNSINTQAIDINGATRTITRVVGLDLPLGVSSTTLSTVTVSIYIAPLSGQVSATVPVTMKNVTPNLMATASPASVTITLKGPLPRLNALQIQPVVDVSGLGAGSYVLPVQVTAPPDVSVQIMPADVTVTLAPLA